MFEKKNSFQTGICIELVQTSSLTFAYASPKQKDEYLEVKN